MRWPQRREDRRELDLLPARQRRPARVGAVAVERRLLLQLRRTRIDGGAVGRGRRRAAGLQLRAYGAVTLSPASGGPANPWRYAGSYQDPTSLYKMGDRYYMAGLMRFTQQDPLESPTDGRQLNRYSYVGDNPVNGTDPTGHSQ